MAKISPNFKHSEELIKIMRDMDVEAATKTDALHKSGPYCEWCWKAAVLWLGVQQTARLKRVEVLLTELTKRFDTIDKSDKS